jgi:predicted anti-sigma-YlaC factor YlaD
MSCEAIQEEISALLDGERSELEAAELEEHLAGCESCRDWHDQAHEVTRRFRLAATSWPPAPNPELLTAVDDASGPAPWASAATSTRLALAFVALLQLVVTVPPLLLGSDRGAPIHVAHEMGSFDLATAVGFLAAAWKPSRARGMQMLVGAAAVLLVVTAVIDIAVARTGVGEELPHLLVVAGWLLLQRLAKLTPIHCEEPPFVLRLPFGRAIGRAQAAGGSAQAAGGSAQAAGASAQREGGCAVSERGESRLADAA